MLGFESIDEV